MRVLSLAPSSTEIVAAIGATDLLVGVTRFCDWPKAVTFLPKVGGWTDVDDDLVAALQPDLVLTSTFVQADAEARFARLGLPVLHVDPKDLAGVRESFLAIGEAIDRLSDARQLLSEFDVAMAAIEPVQPRRSLYVEEWHTPPTPAGNWVPELIQLAGGNNPFLAPGEPSRPVPEAELIAWDPDVIVLSLCGLGKRVKPSLIGHRPGWRHLSAVRNGRVFVIDDSLLNRPGPRLVEGLRTLQKLVDYR